MISTSSPLNLSGKSRVEVETNGEKVEYHKASTIDSSSGRQEENKEKGVRLEKLKSKDKKGEVLVKNDFVVGQQVYYFPPKNHVLFNPKISMHGPFVISKIHQSGAIGIIVNDHHHITVYKERLRAIKGGTLRTIWRPK